MSLTDPTTSPAIRPGTYQIDTKASTVSFRTRHMFGLGAVHGSFTIRNGSITVNEGPSQGRTIEVRIDAHSFDTDTPRRDEHVRGPDFLATSDHPDILFTSDAPLLHLEGGSLAGQLTVTGHTRDVALDVERLTPTADGYTAHATTIINRYDYGITKLRGMAARDLHMALSIVATRQPSGNR